LVVFSQQTVMITASHTAQLAAGHIPGIVNLPNYWIAWGQVHRDMP